MKFLNGLINICNIILLFLGFFLLLGVTYSVKIWGIIDLSQLLFFARTNWWQGLNDKVIVVFLLNCFIIPLILSFIVLYIFYKLKKTNRPYLPCTVVLLYAISLIFFAKQMLTPHELIGLTIILSIVYLINLRRTYSAKNILGLVMLFLLSIGQYFYIKYKDSFVIHSLEQTNFYEQNYIPISNSNLQNLHKRNVILVFLESFNEKYREYIDENSQIMVQDKDAIKFSDFIEGYAQRWTQGALFSAFTGTHIHYLANYYRYINRYQTNSFKNILGYLNTDIANDVGVEFNFNTPNILSIGKITQQAGYHNIFVQGGNLDFSGTRQFLLNHGFATDNILGYAELTKALEKIPDVYDKTMFITFDDRTVFDVFKKKIQNIPSGKPFFATMFTFDMHFLLGEDVNYTKQIHKQTISNLNDFIAWYKEQPFYNDTTLVIIGDHNRMGMEIKTGDKIYNAFFNLPQDLTQNLNVHRKFNQIDIYPTLLEILGFKLPEHKAAIGTSLFSNSKTLAEKYSYSEQEKILSKIDYFYYKLWQSNENSDKNAKMCPKEKLIAHGAGVINGRQYTNSLEALEQAKNRGYKYIEIDLLRTKDGKNILFGAHDYNLFQKFTGVKQFSIENIEKAKIFGKYTPLTEKIILDFFLKNPDLWLVTDKINDMDLLFQKFASIKDRMIVEVSTPKQYEKAKINGIQFVAFNINSIKDIEIVREYRYDFITVSTEFLEKHKRDIEDLRWKIGTKVMLYTAKNNQELRKYNYLADMIYYDGEENLEMLNL